MGAIKYEFPFTICLIIYFLEHEVGAINVCMRDDICVIFVVEVYQLDLITHYQPSLNFQNTLAHREKGKNYFQGPSFEQASILRNY
jgi:hypothetical protein